MEDLFAIFALSILNSLDQVAPSMFVLASAKGAVLIVLAIALSKVFFPAVFKFAAKSREMLFLTSIATCFFFALLANELGFSIAIGAFLAGIMLANLPYNIEIIGKVTPIRDFFATLFFVSLGMQFVITKLSTLVIPLIMFAVVVVVFKPLLIMVITKLFGYTKRTAFLAAISLAQTSEFGLIILSQGLFLGHINQEIFTMAIILAMLTISATAYLIKYDSKIYFSVAKHFHAFDGRNNKKMEYMSKDKKHDVILIGYDRIGYSIRKKMRLLKKRVLIVDFNPDVIKDLIKSKQPCLYGDIGDAETVDRLNLKDAEIVISTAPEMRDNIGLVKALKKSNKKAPIFVTSDNVDDALELYKQGADYVILPHLLGGHHVSLMLEEINGNIDTLLKRKTSHIKELIHRRRLHHHKHPKPKRQH